MADADETVLVGMLHNLLDNAVNFTQAPASHVTLSVSGGAPGTTSPSGPSRTNGPGGASTDDFCPASRNPFEHAGHGEGLDTMPRAPAWASPWSRRSRNFTAASWNLTASPGAGLPRHHHRCCPGRLPTAS